MSVSSPLLPSFFPVRFSSLSCSILEFEYCQFRFSLEEKWQFKTTCLLSSMWNLTASQYICGRHTACLQAGIGTYTIPQVAKPMMAKVHKVLDAMIGVHLNAHVMSERICNLILLGAPTWRRNRWLWISHAKLWAVIFYVRRLTDPTCLDEYGDKISLFGLFFRIPSQMFLTYSHSCQGFHEEHVSGARFYKESLTEFRLRYCSCIGWNVSRVILKQASSDRFLSWSGFIRFIPS